MKLVFEKDNLLTALVPAAAMAPNKNTNFVLECVLFECTEETDGKCKITAYDMEKGLRTYVECECIEEGSFAMNSQQLLQIVRSMPEGEITIEIDKRSRAKIYSGMVSFEIGAVPGESYPTLPILNSETVYTMPQHIFRTMVYKTIFAIAQNEQGKAFSGVLFKIENGKMSAVGCDRFMIAVAEYESEKEVEDCKFIMPGRILSEITKSVKDTEDEMEITVARKHIVMKIGEFMYFSRLIDDEYFNYKKIFSIPCETHIFVNCGELKASVERASIVTEEKIGGKAKNSLILNYKEDSIEISSVSANGSVHDEIVCSTENMENSILFKYNCRYVMNVLRACDDANTVKISLSGPTMGMTVENGDSDNKNPVSYKFYIMPMNNAG